MTGLDFGIDTKQKRRVGVKSESSIGSPYSPTSPGHSESIFDAERVSEHEVFTETSGPRTGLEEEDVWHDNSVHIPAVWNGQGRPSVSWRRQRLSAQYEMQCEPRAEQNERTGHCRAVFNRHVGNHSSRCLPLSQCKQLTPQQAVHSRSLSMNDLDCRFGSISISRTRMLGPSPSSEDALERAARGLCFPFQPTRPPPERCETPRGLPSFGTHEAQQLRLTPRSRLSGILSDLKDRLQRRRNLDDSWDENSGPDQTHSTTSLDMLRRMLGSSRPVPRPTRSVKEQSATLPRGIRVSATPGALARAEDGTIIRGRFGARASAHGVGQSPLSDHALVRLEGQAEIDEAVAAIEKACQGIGSSERDQVRTADAFTSANRPRHGSVSHSTEALQSQQEEIRRLRVTLRELQQPSHMAAGQTVRRSHPSGG